MIMSRFVVIPESCAAQEWVGEKKKPNLSSMCAGKEEEEEEGGWLHGNNNNFLSQSSSVFPSAEFGH